MIPRTYDVQLVLLSPPSDEGDFRHHGRSCSNRSSYARSADTWLLWIRVPWPLRPLCVSGYARFRIGYLHFLGFRHTNTFPSKRHSYVHCGSAFEPGASGLPYYCTPPVRVPVVIGALAAELCGGITTKQKKPGSQGKRLWQKGCASESSLTWTEHYKFVPIFWNS